MENSALVHISGISRADKSDRLRQVSNVAEKVEMNASCSRRRIRSLGSRPSSVQAKGAQGMGKSLAGLDPLLGNQPRATAGFPWRAALRRARGGAPGQRWTKQRPGNLVWSTRAEISEFNRTNGAKSGSSTTRSRAGARAGVGGRKVLSEGVYAVVMAAIGTSGRTGLERHRPHAHGGGGRHADPGPVRSEPEQPICPWLESISSAGVAVGVRKRALDADPERCDIARPIVSGNYSESCVRNQF
jgi:hypothetical protein